MEKLCHAKFYWHRPDTVPVTVWHSFEAKFKSMYYVYVLKSRRIRRTYAGCSYNPTERLKVHNSGAVQSTKNGRPWQIVYQEEHASLSEARDRERYFKTGGGRRRIRRIIESLKI